MLSNASDDDTRRLALVFFDILFLDSKSLVHRPYGERRAVLERTVKLRQGYAMLAERTPVEMKSPETGVQQLESAFAKLLADHQEGAVLKAEESRYCDWGLRWVKVGSNLQGYAIWLLICSAPAIAEGRLHSGIWCVHIQHTE